MRDKDQQRLNRQFDRLEGKLPQTVARWLQWLRKPSSRLIRIPLGILLVIGGIFSFLPVLGIWMLPLGLLLLAIDLPFLQRPITRLITWGERRWTQWRKSRKRGAGQP